MVTTIEDIARQAPNLMGGSLSSIVPARVSVEADIRQAHVVEMSYQLYGTPEVQGTAVQYDSQGRKFTYNWRTQAMQTFENFVPQPDNSMLGGTMARLMSSGADVRLNHLDIEYPQTGNGVSEADVNFGTVGANYGVDTTGGSIFGGVRSWITPNTSIDFGAGATITVGSDGYTELDLSNSTVDTYYTIGGDGLVIHGPASDTRTRRCLEVKEGPEEVARSLLRRMVGVKAFRNYIRNGFISYRSKSGKVYQIYPGSQMTKVWQNGQPLKTLCVVFKDYSLPPTDWVIMRLLMLEHDEAAFWALANKFEFSRPVRAAAPVEVPGGRILRLAEQRRALGLRANLQPANELVVRVA